MRHPRDFKAAEKRDLISRLEEYGVPEEDLRTLEEMLGVTGEPKSNQSENMLRRYKAAYFLALNPQASNGQLARASGATDYAIRQWRKDERFEKSFDVERMVATQGPLGDAVAAFIHDCGRDPTKLRRLTVRISGRTVTTKLPDVEYTLHLLGFQSGKPYFFCAGKSARKL
jgi:hypothetical protein